MTDEDAFIRSICLSPEDDAPRGVFADWLDEHAGDAECDNCHGYGQKREFYGPDDNYDSMECHPCFGTGRISNGFAERAEFIRTQLEAERLDRIVTSGIYTPGPPSNAPDTSKEFARLCELRKRERELLLRHRDAWFRPPVEGLVSVVWNHPAVEWMRPEDVEGTAAGSGEDVWSATFRRGFVDQVECSTKNFTGACGWMFERHPITRVRLSDRIPYDAHGEMKPIWVDVGKSIRGGRDNPMDLPSELFEIICRDPKSHDPHGRRPLGYWVDLEYDTREEAYKALSDACVLLGRSRAGIISENPRPSAEPGNGGG